VVRASISRADALSEVGPDGATYYILKVGLDVSFNDVRTGQVFYATYVEDTQQERVRAGERSLDLAVSYRNLLQRTMSEVGRRVAAEYAPVNAEGTVRAVKPDGSLVLAVTGAGALPAGGIVTLWSDGEQVRDPRSGVSLGSVQEAAARIRVVRPAGAEAEAVTIGAATRPLAGARFAAPATVGDAGRQLVQVQRVEVREGVAVPGALLEEIVQSALTRSRRYAVLSGPDVLADLAALREREFGGGGFSNQAAQRLINVENAQPALSARVVARFLAPVPARENDQPAQGYEARIGIFLVSAADTTRAAASGAQSLQSRFALPRGGRREVVVGLSAQDVAKIYAGMSRELARTVVEQLAAAQ